MAPRFGVYLWTAFLSLAMLPSTLLTTQIAGAEPSAPPGTPLSASQALSAAKRSGLPVVATALTDEHTMVTASPTTGLLTAEVTAGVARVRDGSGIWREPSATLTRGADGKWRPEAAAISITVSGGGVGPVVSLGEGLGRVAFDWPSSLPEPVVDGNTATYPNVAVDTDLVVRANTDGAETFLVVKSAQGGRDPLVRSMPITASTPGLKGTAHANGVVSYADAVGKDHFWMPPAFAWESKGQPVNARAADLLDVAEGARITALPARISKTGRSASFATTTSTSILDDPTTVYPVIIDPSYTMPQSYAVRVTQDFVKYNGDIGSEGKIGYNGWTSPYYKSRMFYQFRWPTNADGSLIKAAQVAGAEFQYVQVHSPQHDCGDHDFGPSVKVQFHTVIDGNTKWSGPGVHPNIGSKTSDYAVGHENTCNDEYTQKWNVTSMATNERTNYSTRTTVTVGVQSSDETDKNGWREYKNSSSSPKLVVNYEPEPPVPTGFTVTNTVLLSPLTTNAPAPTLGVTPALASGYLCRTTTACLQAEFTVKKGTTVVKAATLSGAVIVNSPTQARLVLSGLTNGSYSALVRTYNVDTKLYSTSSATFPFIVNLPPGQPTWSWVLPAGWTNPDALPYNQVLQLQVAPAVGDTDVTVYCANIVQDQQTLQQCSPPVNGRINVGPFATGTAQVSVSAKDAYSIGAARMDSPTERTFSW